MKHPHDEHIRFCLDNYERAQWQGRFFGCDWPNDWVDVRDDWPYWRSDEYRTRLRPETVTRTITYPKPETVEPPLHTRYFVADPWLERWYEEFEWCNDPTDKRWLALGIIHLTAEAARAHGMALAGVSDGPEAA